MTNTAKPAKRKGPIRWEAVIPFTIFVALVWAYFFLFFDSHLRRGLEFVGTQGNGAEVNIGGLRTSFWGASLEISDVQVTNVKEPAKNVIQIGSIRWKMLWDALLRGKVAIEEASVLGIAVGAPRAKPGYVVPPPPPPPPDSKPGMMAKLKEQALAKAQEEFSNNILGDVAGLLAGADPAAQLKNLEGTLKSSIRIKELQTELKKKEQEWKDRLAKLPKQEEIKAIEGKLKAVKLDKFNNPAEVQQSVQQLDAIFKEIDTKIKEVDSTKNGLNGDVATYQNSFKDLEAMVQQDIKDLENRIQLPKIDAKSLSRSLFGNQILDKVRLAESYVAKARQYAPPKKTAEEKAAYQPPTPRERAAGRNYKFGRPNSYPLFWLKKAQISSTATAGAEWSGDMTGTLQDLTDEPPAIGRPTLLTFKGDFPKQQVLGVDGQLSVDHVTENPKETFTLKVASFPIDQRVFVNSPDVKLGLDGAGGSTAFEVELAGDSLKITSNSTFQPQPQPQKQFLFAEAQQPLLAEILKGALGDVKKVTVNASVGGTWSDLRFDIDSSLGRDLTAAFEKRIQAKIDEARAKLQAFINENIGKERERLMAEFNKAKAQIDELIKQKLEEINKEKGTVEKAKTDAINNQTKGIEGEAKKAVDDLKKRFGF